MKADFLFAGLKLNRIIQKKKCRKKVDFMDDALKTWSIIYLNVDAWLFSAHPIEISGCTPDLGGVTTSPALFFPV